MHCFGFPACKCVLHSHFSDQVDFILPSSLHQSTCFPIQFSYFPKSRASIIPSLWSLYTAIIHRNIHCQVLFTIIKCKFIFYMKDHLKKLNGCFYLDCEWIVAKKIKWPDLESCLVLFFSFWCLQPKIRDNTSRVLFLWFVKRHFNTKCSTVHPLLL